MTEEDLASHYTTFPTPIMTNYRGVTPTPISDLCASDCVSRVASQTDSCLKLSLVHNHVHELSY